MEYKHVLPMEVVTIGDLMTVAGLVGRQSQAEPAALKNIGLGGIFASLGSGLAVAGIGQEQWIPWVAFGVVAFVGGIYLYNLGATTIRDAASDRRRDVDAAVREIRTRTGSGFINTSLYFAGGGASTDGSTQGP